MPTLIVEQDNRRKGTVLNGRLVIGRRPQSHIAIPDRTVSRIHAWIGMEFDRYFVCDSTSRSGTLLNGERLRGRQTLSEGDVIQIASVRMKYHDDDVLPPDVEVLDFKGHTLQGEDGIFLDCDCGAPIWTPWETAGKRGRCRDCGRLLQLPNPPEAKLHADPNEDTQVGGVAIATQRRTAGSVRLDKPPTAPAARSTRDLGDGHALDARPTKTIADKKPETVCGACQAAISVLDEKTSCPECGATFHTECWKENGGCSSYGCSQVGVLDRQAIEAAEKARARTEARLLAAVQNSPTPRPHAAQSVTRADSSPKNSHSKTLAATALVATAKKPARLASGHPVSTSSRAIMERDGQPSQEDDRGTANHRRVQWGYALLPAALMSGIAGLFIFGVPSLLLAVAIVVNGIRKPVKNRQFIDAILLLSIVLSAVGGAFSTWWWLSSPAIVNLQP
jgi:hypothetical protein